MVQMYPRTAKSINEYYMWDPRRINDDFIVQQRSSEGYNNVTKTQVSNVQVEQHMTKRIITK